MTIKELREKIAELPDDATMEIAIGTYTKAFPVAYVEPHSPQVWLPRERVDGEYKGMLRLFANLPEGASVSIRKGSPADTSPRNGKPRTRKER